MTTSTQHYDGGHPVGGHGPLLPVDVALGLARPAWRVATGTSHAVSLVAGPLVRLSLRPPGVPEPLQPARWLGALARSGGDRREFVAAEVSERLDLFVPLVLDNVLDRVDLTAVVLERVDLQAVVTTVLDRLDLTAVVLERVDLEAVVTTVLDRLDLIAIAEEVIDGVDLPEIIRESTGSMASDTVRGARMQGISADEAVGRAVDRLLLRHGRKGVHPPEHAGVAGDPTVASPVTERAP